MLNIVYGMAQNNALSLEDQAQRKNLKEFSRVRHSTTMKVALIDWECIYAVQQPAVLHSLK